MSGPYDQHLASSQGYNNQYPAYGYNQGATSAYPAERFSQPASYSSCYSQPQSQSYYNDTRSSYPQDQHHYASNSSSYNNNNAAQPQPGQEQDRGLLGAMAGGAAGAWGGHKAGHGVLGALGGAILGSLTEDYAKKGKKNKHHKSRAGSHSSGNSNSGFHSSNSMSGLGPVASSFFNHKK